MQNLFCDKIMSNNIDVVIITALDKERNAVQRYLDKFQQIESNIFNLPHNDTNSSYRVALLCVGKMGSVEAGIATTTAIADFNPSIVILVGIMGGVKGDDRNLGDLIVADQIVGYEQAKINDIDIERRYEVHRPNNELLEATKNSVLTISPTVPSPNSQNTIPNIHWGLVASGEKVIADSKTIPELQKSWSKVIGVEMESYGVALAIYNAESRPRFLMVKSICDWANSEKNDNWQEYSADVAAEYVVSFLRSNHIQHNVENDIIPKSSLDLYNRIRKLPRPLFNDICFYLQEKYEYDLSFINVNNAPSDSAHQLIEFLKQYPQGVNHLQQLLEERGLL